MSVFEQLGSLALATRLKLLSETLAKDVASVYKQLDIEFEPRWFTLFWTLKDKQTLTITELANELRQTHTAVVQVTNLLEKKGLILSSKDKNDERRRQVSLSPKGLRLFEQVEPVLNAIEQANDELLNQHAPDLLYNLNAIEEYLDQKSMHDRILDHLALIHQGVVIKNYTPAYKEYFFNLNREWIEEHFGALDNEDLQALQHPEEEILDPGGMIFFAQYNKQIVGTAAIQAEGKNSFRLSMFAVSKELRSKGIGKALYEHAIQFARAKGAATLAIFTSPLLTDSLNFYIRNGFYAVNMSKAEQENFRRPTIKMQLKLN
ncbi:bifunctional helix-turn-helix transcriptional regulator/GNAT family N-acetyltransferase [Cesiribacter sp. SM1]|uniref:bifunctional helix-turn-helix transcriptional regulator/GNAT family N-acetyltransferase n=1 Tax=Cesiribacter sp. SM1 TaxID=2861196 RepID=UPI001CD2E7BE|nr:bifunctional helix-turn-helix transcriptional regulator/GNAT family N-acetyltransferase [Cesiribacter sp. SM1]